MPPPADSEPPAGTEPPRTPVPRGVFTPGEQFGVYRVGPCIGEGGMARVYQAEHSGLRRQVALKVLLDASTRAPEGLERFLLEARSAAAIKHPNVVNIFDVGVHDGTPFLVMELLTGTDLEQLLQSRGALDEATIVDIMIPVIAGLTAVHDAGVVHRDLKPGNIFLAQGRYDEVDPKLLDFGICRAPGVEQLRLTANGMLIGTPFYMSPEGLRGDEMTPLSDQYSLGVVMYECATGANPFGAPTFAEIFKLIGAGQYPAPSTSRPQISKRLERIITRAMSLDPAQRYKDLREMGRELLLLAGQRTRITWALSFGELERAKLSGVAWDPQRSLASAPPPAMEPKRRAALVLAPLLLLVAAVVLVWAGVFSDEPRQRSEPSASAATAPPQPAVGAVASPAPPTPAAVAVAQPAAKPLDESSAAPPRRLRSASARHQAVNGGPGGAQVSKPDDAEPDWASPTATTTTSQVKAGVRAPVGVGANGAPIFD
jgi:serine/threonine protein kinase